MPRQSKTRKPRKTGSRRSGSQTKPETKFVHRSDFSDLPKVEIDIGNGRTKTFDDYSQIAIGYATAVVDGINPSCSMVKKACIKYLKMRKEAKKETSEYYYSPDHVTDYCGFQESLRHVETGLWMRTQKNADGTVNDFIVLEPWQIWIESAIHGFRWKVNDERVVSTSVEIVPRKHGKTLRLAGAALFDLCCSGQMGAQIPISAPTSIQADQTLYGIVQKMLNKNYELIETFGITSTNDSVKTADGKIWKLTAQANRQDGLNPSLAIFEEGHQGHADVYKVVRSAFGARPNALIRMISTAGVRPEGPCYELLLQARIVLNGKNDDPTFFAAIYELDKEDYLDGKTHGINWDKILINSEELVQKVNPMYGVSLDPIKIKTDLREAIRRKDFRGEIARTRFNIWTAQGEALIPVEDWAACKGKVTLSDFIGQKCWVGVDLAESSDMCAIGMVFEMPGNIIAVFAKYFIPELSETYNDPDLFDQFQVWAADEENYLEVTSGGMADHDRVREEVEVICEVFDVQGIACDPYQAHNTIKILWDGQKPVLIYPNNAATMTAPTDDILARIINKNICHDGNPVLMWNASNVHGERKGNGSIVPRKETPKSKRKIDGFVAICMAEGVRLNPDLAKPMKNENGIIDPFIARGGQLLGYKPEEARNG